MSAPQTAPNVAMVLAAGLGTRMRPLTDRTAKALVEVAGRPLVDRALDRVAAAGLDRAVVNVHHFADRLEAHLARRAPPRIAISDERAALLDTGGGVAKALPHLGEVFLVLNSDAVFTGAEPLARLLAAWAERPEDTEAVMLLVAREGARAYARPGDFFLAADGAVPERRGARRAAPFVYTGAQILTAGVFTPEERVSGAAFSLNPVWDRLIARGRLRGVVHDGLWVDVGTPAGVEAAEAALAEAG